MAHKGMEELKKGRFVRLEGLSQWFRIESKHPFRLNGEWYVNLSVVKPPIKNMPEYAVRITDIERVTYEFYRR